MKRVPLATLASGIGYQEAVLRGWSGLHLAAMTDGNLTTQLLYIAARLQLADRLAAGPRSCQELAQEAGIDPPVMHRLLRGLAADGVLEEQPNAMFALTDLGQPLRADH